MKTTDRINNENSDLPEGWKNVLLGDILISLEAGSRPKGGVRGIEDGYPSIGGEHLNSEGGFNIDNIKFVPKIFGDKINAGRIKEKDILIVKDGATTGKVSFVDDHFPYKTAFVNEHVFICRVYKQLNAKYLFWFLWSEEGQRRILNNFKGSAQGGINTSFISNTIIPLPPIVEQNEIVERLNELIEKLKSAKNVLSQIPLMIEAAREKVIASGITGKLSAEWRKSNIHNEFDVALILKNVEKREIQFQISESKRHSLKLIFDTQEKYHFTIPNNWRFVRLGKLCSEFKYGTSRKSERTGNRIVLRMGNIQNGKIDWSSLKYTSNIEDINKYNLTAGDLLFNRTNSPELVGKTAIYQGEKAAIFAGYLIRIKTLQELNFDYLNFILNSNYAKSWCHIVKSDGVSQSNINAQKLSEFEIPFCGVEEQLYIVERITNIFEALDKVSERYKLIANKLNESLKQVLSLAFSGSLSTQMLTDSEFVDDLLEEFKNEKKIYEDELRVKRKNTRTMRAKKGQTSLSEILLQEFNDQYFTFDEIRNIIKKDYSELKEDLFDLLDKNIIAMQFDEHSLIIRYKYSINEN